MHKKTNLLIYGEALIDEFSQQQELGGVPFNVARGLSLLGASPLMVTRLGRDVSTDFIQAEFGRVGLSVEAVQSDGIHATGRVLVHQNRDQASDRSFEILSEQAHDYIESLPVMELLNTHFRDAPPDLIYFGTLIQRNLVSQQTLMTILESELTEGATKFLDLNLHDSHATAELVGISLNYADMVKLTVEELQFVIQNCCLNAQHLGKINPDAASLQVGCEALMSEFYMQAIIVTLDCGDYFYLDANGEALSSFEQSSVDGQSVNAVSVDDGFTAAFIYGWQTNWPVAKSLAFAQQVAVGLGGVRAAVTETASFYVDQLQQFESV